MGWTAVVMAWGTVAIARVSGTESAAVPSTPPTPAPAADVVADTVSSTVPVMPEGGLVVIRYTPAPPKPATRVVTRVVEQRVVVQVAPTPASSGS